MTSGRDIEEAASETEPLLKEDVLNKLHNEHVIGLEMGNPKFWRSFELGVRTAIWCSLMGCLVWNEGFFHQHPVLGTDLAGYADYMPTAICILIYTIDPHFGTVLRNAAASITGVAFATLNIVLLRGIFPNGVEPGMPTFSIERIAGWANALAFNFIFLVLDCQNKTRIFAIAQNMASILAFLDPDNKISFSKNFEVTWSGAAVRGFVGCTFGAVFALLVMLVPYPFGVAFPSMRSNASKATADMAKMFILATSYCNGREKTLRIEQHMRELQKLREQIDGMEGSIVAAFEERSDIGSSGVVRGFMQKHCELMEELYDIVRAFLMALEIEEFGPNHMKIAQDVGTAASELTDQTALLLLAVTDATSDAYITDEETEALISKERVVKLALSKMSSDFDKVRREFSVPLSRDLFGGSSMVAALSAYARHVCDYSEMLRTNPPRGVTMSSAFIKILKKKVMFEPITRRRVRFVLRYMVGLTAVLAFAVGRDGYHSACAITAAYLLNVEPSPNLKGSLDVVIAIVFSSIIGSLIFGWSCQTGYGLEILPFVFAVYMSMMVYLAKSGSSFAHLGFFSAAFAPYRLVLQCPAANDARSAKTALELWTNVRARVLAMVILTFCEFACMERRHSDLATQWYEKAIMAVQEGLKEVLDAKDPKPAMEDVSTSLALAAQFSKGAALEPRLDACAWQATFLADCISAVSKMRSDLVLCYRAVQGQEEDFKRLREVESFRSLQEDLIGTLEEAREMSVKLLLHRSGRFAVLADEDIKGGTCRRNSSDKLPGLDAALASSVHKLSSAHRYGELPHDFSKDPGPWLSQASSGPPPRLARTESAPVARLLAPPDARLPFSRQATPTYTPRLTVSDAARLVPPRSQDPLLDAETMDTAIGDLLEKPLTPRLPPKAPETMETDPLCKLSMQITMLDFMKKHISSIVHSAVKHV